VEASEVKESEQEKERERKREREREKEKTKSGEIAIGSRLRAFPFKVPHNSSFRSACHFDTHNRETLYTPLSVHQTRLSCILFISLSRVRRQT